VSGPAVVHPLAPRFAQGITGVLCLEALLFDQPAAVAVAFALVLIAVVAPRLSPVGWVFRRVAPPPGEMEPVAPVRFSQVLAVVFLGAALVLYALGWTPAAGVLTGMVTALALLSALTGICVGCEVYRLALSRTRRGAAGEDVRGDLGLDGAGPWLVVLTAPGCARCEPAARELESVAGGPVTRVDLTRRPGAARLPVRSVPAALAVAPDGSLRAVRAGRLDRAALAEVAAAV
jgi:hypothetical protein